jgi:ribosomal-protein-serine acetyltransferase
MNANLGVVETAAGPLTIRPWHQSDADQLVNVITDNLDHLRPFMPWIANEPLNLEQRRTLIAQWASDAANGGDVVFGLFLDSAIVGGAGLHRRLGPGGLEIGYWVHRAYVRRGIATAAARVLTDAAFARPAIDRVEIHHDAANVASSGVPETLGYALIGTEPRPIIAPAETGVHWIWRVTRADWMATAP